MINEINELSLSQNGSLSAKDLRLFLLKNFHNKKYILSCDSRKSVFENDIEYIIKLIEDNTYMIRDMINSVIKYEELKPESLGYSTQGQCINGNYLSQAEKPMRAADE